MFGNFGFQELVVVLIIALIIFGPSKLPELGRALGRGIREFKKATTEIEESITKEVNAVKDNNFKEG
ncbi:MULTISPECIES: twin-arginine translocase TatA/TatE family subunit [Carboxydothermus]|uniref:Sec-independent protein translocase protein TatA n=2 Tax=Carboxydothermus TaxID=129957 RepID=Q3ADR8_CARHZ|nr:MULTISPECIES: twin-arginine translocase TatA/TatE family subunit [Carboxydothermus]ABB16031.1 twin-arginine translocation protein, TatA/E family [Carboxydothermus hydrogenoformans Z-2901]NYE56769.1 sec-independent protein translocase protein TatA [Carboxydothermus ferrireducens DSM 11255]